ncbi:hypothetical protein QN277_009163 [Acacia crassicarpa]|uniref:RNase H type-1 domain-containing protein n=1 Tax=Acacia crassicarpa TaxID=499986 RepID=A0AAE1ISV4_9FABA|nr:hypothetical protein QN277_009163 [Acacia crassicarpa]
MLICWWLWRRRNVFLFEGKRISKHAILASVEAIWRSLHDAHSRFSQSFGQECVTSKLVAQWQTPPEGWVKVNIDGAFSHFVSGVACGGVVRDTHGNFIKGFLFKGLEGDCLSAKLWGCLHGLKLSWDLGYRNVILESDSADVVDLLRREMNDLHADRNIIAEIHSLMRRDWRLDVRLISRWANTAADYLAKAGFSAMAGFHTVVSPDAELYSLLVKDNG